MEPSVPAEVEGEQKERKKIHFAVPASVSADVEGEQKERKKIHFAVPASVSADVEGEQKERKKIHFAVPASVPTNLDPRQVEMIRRRRPTPATLFRVADQASPEDDQSTHQVKWVVGENGVLKPKRVNPNVYQPPSLKAVQKMAEAHMQNLGVYPPLEDPSEGEEYEDHWQGEEGDHSSPTQAADHPEAAATDQPQSAKQIQVQEEEEDEAAAEEEEEAEEVDRVAKAEETTEGERKRGGSN